jgi:hypothetical protein
MPSAAEESAVPVEPLSSGERAWPCEPLLEAATTELYQRNPFRRAGLPVLAGPRQISRRVDQLRLELELGTLAFGWAFAPPPVTSGDEIRQLLQEFRDPRQRLIAEFFWFWPEKYPDDAADPAIEYLAAGDKSRAFRQWCRTAAEGNSSANHNLAVYFHLQALEQEQNAELPDEELNDLWQRALYFWEQIAEEKEFWARLQGRVVKLGDPQLKAEFVAQMRGSLREALSRINASLALKNAEHGRSGRAAMHIALLGVIHRDPSFGQRTAEKYTAPVVHRIEARIAEARRSLAADPARGLTLAGGLIEECRDDVSLVELLCGPTTEFYVELSNAVASAALDCAVTYQRVTLDHRGCLPLVAHLLELKVLPELNQRLRHTHAVLQENVLYEGNATTEI